MALLIAITGPIAAAKNTVASLLVELLAEAGRTTVIADVDDVAHQVAGPGRGRGYCQGLPRSSRGG
jgi:dephospho-CoA kinase